MDSIGWIKAPAFTGTIHQGCLCCPPVEPKAPMNMLIAVGFGEATVRRDGEVVLDGENMPEDATDYYTLKDAEKLAAADPHHDWRVTLFAPMRGRVYQRHDVGTWVLIESNNGFAGDDE